MKCAEMIRKIATFGQYSPVLPVGLLMTIKNRRMAKKVHKLMRSRITRTMVWGADGLRDSDEVRYFGEGTTGLTLINRRTQDVVFFNRINKRKFKAIRVPYSMDCLIHKAVIRG